jgi:hypothetical protein
VDSENTSSETFLPARCVAAEIGVPAAWLIEEAKAGRVPVLRAGNRLLMNPALVARALLERAALSQQDREVANVA